MTQKTIAGTEKFVPVEEQAKDIDDNFDELYAAGLKTVYNLRQRVVIADINSGITLLAAVAGKQYRLVSCNAIAYGGAVGTLTTVDLLGTQSSGVKLVAYAQASLTQSTVLKDGGTGAAVLADGASYVACDVNTAITIGKTGGTGDTATGVDINLSYTLE